MKKYQNYERHGMIHTAEYKTWQLMRNRCYNKNSNDYMYYGKRGICVCNRWLNSFVAFYEDMGERPSDKHSIDRINNDGDYAPGNCRWATKQQQSRNKGKYKNNSSGHKGVKWSKRSQKWQVQITSNKKRIHLGYFIDFEEAIQARKDAEKQYWTT